MGCSPLIYPGYIPITDDINRGKAAAIWNVPFEALSAKIGLTTVEIMQAARDGKVKGLYIMGEIHTIRYFPLIRTEKAMSYLLSF